MAYTNTAEKSFRVFIDESYKRRGHHLSPHAAVWLWSFVLNCFAAGNFIGGICAPLLTDNLGRKFTLICGMIGNIAACVLGSVAIAVHCPELFILSRMLGGAMSSINFGGLSLIIMECAPTELRGTCCFASGTTFAAAMLIGTLAGHNIDTNKMIEEIRLEEEDEMTDKSSWVILKELFTIPHLRTAMYLGLCALQISASAYLGVNLVASILGTFIIGRVSRKWMLILSGFANVFALAFYVGFDRMFDLNTRVYGILCLIAILVYYVSSGIGFGIISFYVTGELLPQLHRALGQTVVFSISLLVSFVLSMITVPAYESYNVWVFIPLFIVPNGLCLCYLWAYLPETRNREIHEIVAELKMLHGKATWIKNVCSNAKLDPV
ncbi:sugar transporter domain-containing protein [Ditylenchus destructor]|nr:sugar transporter domain-containing protein [Ditylenchus destructor]